MNYRTNNCGELNISHCGKSVKLCGWVSKIRDKGHLKWIDLRDIHGTTQLVFDRDRTKKNVLNIAKKIGREFVIQISGKVVEINEELTNNPEYVNEDCYEKGWIVKLEVENSNDLEKLLGSSDYEKII